MSVAVLTKRVLKAAAVCLVVAAIVCAALAGLSRTETVRRALSARAAQALSDSLGVKIAIPPPDTLSWSRLHTKSIVVSDADGECIRVDDVTLAWSVRSLLHFPPQYHVTALTIGAVSMARAPKRSGVSSEPLDLEGTVRSLSRFRIDELSIADAALRLPGPEPELHVRVHGDLAHGAAPHEQRSSLIIEPVSGPRMEGSATVVLREGLSQLEVEAHYAEPEGGLAAQLLGRNDLGALSAGFTGSGSLTDWHGHVEAHASLIGDLDANLAMAAGATTRVALDGTAHVATLGQDIQFKSAADVNWPATVTIESSELRCPFAASSITFAGAVDLKARTMSATFDAQAGDTSPLGMFGELKVDAPLAVHGTVNGPILKPALMLETTLNNLEATGFRATSVEAKAEADLVAPELHLRANGKVGGIETDKAPVREPISGTWVFDATMPDRSHFQIAQCGFSNEHLDVSLAGTVDIAERSCELDASVSAQDVAYFAPNAGYDGSLSMRASVAGALLTRTLHGTLKGSLERVTGAPAPIMDLAGPTYEFATSIELSDKGIVHAKDVRIDAGDASVEGKLSYDLASKAVKSEYRLKLPDGDKLARALKRPIKAALSAEGSVEGTWPKLAARVKAEAREASYGAYAADLVELSAKLDDFPQHVRGHAEIQAARHDDRFTAESDFAMRDGELGVSSFKAGAPGMSANGSLKLDTRTRLARGALHAEARDLAALGRLAGREFGGRASVDVTLKSDHGRQDIQATLEGNGLRTAAGSIERAQGSVTMKDAFQKGTGKLTAKLETCRVAGVALDRASVSCEGNLRDVAFETSAEGTYRGAFRVKARGKAGLNDGAVSCDLRSLDGAWNDIPLKLKEAAHLTYADGSFDLKSVSIAIDKGSIKARFSCTQEGLDANADFEKVAIERLFPGEALPLTGTAVGHVECRGPWDAVEGAADLKLADLRPTQRKLQSWPATEIVANATLRGGMFRAEIKDNGGLLGKPIAGSAAAPLNVSLRPWLIDMPRDGTLDGRLSVETQLDRVGQLMRLDDQRLGGGLQAELRLGGTLERPEISGAATVEQGSYDHFGMGTMLREIRVKLKGEGSRLRIEEASATDGAQGAISASGGMDLDRSKQFPVDVAIQVAKSALLRRDDIGATVSGELKLAGPFAHPCLSGGLRSNAVEIQILRREKPPMASVEIVDLNKPAQTEEPERPSEHKLMRRIALDLNVDLPNQVFVRGPGLDSEWKGKLTVGGSAGHPEPRGPISLVRGRLNLLGKRFTLTKGEVTLNGAWPPVPALDIVAETTVKDMTAYLKIAGSSAAPELALESNPTLPQNEILARLLFGINAAHISPVEALQLAEAADALSGDLGIFRTTDRVRRILRVDELDVTQESGDMKDTAVSAGKYIGNNVYVGVEQGLNTDKSKVRAEVEITPHLSVESTTSRDAKTGIGLKWKKDY